MILKQKSKWFEILLTLHDDAAGWFWGLESRKYHVSPRFVHLRTQRKEKIKTYFCFNFLTQNLDFCFKIIKFWPKIIIFAWFWSSEDQNATFYRLSRCKPLVLRAQMDLRDRSLHRIHCQWPLDMIPTVLSGVSDLLNSLRKNIPFFCTKCCLRYLHLHGSSMYR